jgi:hypothetical protein
MPERCTPVAGQRSTHLAVAMILSANAVLPTAGLSRCAMRDASK